MPEDKARNAFVPQEAVTGTAGWISLKGAMESMESSGDNFRHRHRHPGLSQAELVGEHC